MNLYVIFDRVAEESGPIFEAKNDGTAARAARDLVATAKGARAHEFQLLKLGTIDHEKNAITPLPVPEDVHYMLQEEEL